MLPVLLSTACFPPVSWMACLLASSTAEIEARETYPKQTYRNRYHLATAAGVLKQVVPVKKTNGNHTQTIDIQIDNATPWQKIQWRAIVSAYSKSPYFLYYRDLLEPQFLKKHTSLLEMNAGILSQLLSILKVPEPEIRYTNEYISKPALPDLRQAIHPKKAVTEALGLVFPRYMQAFEAGTGFLPDLSILDVIFNLGPDAAGYISGVAASFDPRCMLTA